MLPCRRLMIAGRVYRIRWFTKAELRLITDRWGECNYENGLIRLDPRLKANPENLLNTMVHEILHAIWDQMFIGDDSNEERDVTCVANALAGVLRDNPKFATWVTAMAQLARKQNA